MNRQGSNQSHKSQRKQYWNRAKEETRRSRHQSFDNSRAVVREFYQPPDDPTTSLPPLELEARAISNSQSASRAMPPRNDAKPSLWLPHSWQQVPPVLHHPVPEPYRKAQPKFQPADSYDDWISKERLKPGGRSKNEQLGSAAESWGLDNRPRKGMFQHEDSPPSRNVSPYRIPASDQIERIQEPNYVDPWQTETPAPPAPWTNTYAPHARPPWAVESVAPTPVGSPLPNYRQPEERQACGARPLAIPKDTHQRDFDAFGPVRPIPRK